MRLATSVRHRTYRRHSSSGAARIYLLLAFVTTLFIIILLRLFQLQVFHFDEYSETAKDQHFGAITLPARRGEILAQETHSGNLSKLATNTTLDLLYVDPLIADDKVGIAKNLAPLLFDRQDYDNCTAKPDECPYDPLEDEPLKTDSSWMLGDNSSSNATDAESPKRFKSYPKMVDEVAASILRKISKTEVDFTILKREASEELMADVINAGLPGIFADKDRFMIYGDPTLIPENRLTEVAQALAPMLNDAPAELEKQLSRRKVRYVFLDNRLDPEISRKIKEMDMKGVVLLPEHWRFYPEGNLAPHLVGFLSRDGIGQYGVEGYFNVELEGKKGTIYAESDPFGRQITVGDSKIINPVDGDTIVLTIDRIIQKKVEEILAEAVERYRADSGQVIIMDPFSGDVIAMANYPSFDPNNFSSVYRLRELKQDEIEDLYSTVPVFKRNEQGTYIPIDEGDLENEEVQKYIYENKYGPEVFKNKAISEFYEPGSVFKTIVMSIAIDANEVSPETTFIDDGPLEIDEFTIKNSDGEYHGKTTMTEVLEKSLNTGMSFVAQKLGKKLFHKYLTDFGFGEYTNIRLEGENKGRVDYYNKWSKAQLLTTSFGQGIVATPLQVITAWAALANGGKLMQPHIVDSVIREGEVIESEPKIVNRVISEETASIITAMSVSAVQRGVARPAHIPGYLIAGKTGTSQVAGRSGKYLEGEGSTITSFAGYLPALEPKFVMLVKFDRPRIGENTWGSTTAAPTFRRVAEFLIDYYNIQPSS